MVNTRVEEVLIEQAMEHLANSETLQKMQDSYKSTNLILMMNLNSAIHCCQTITKIAYFENNGLSEATTQTLININNALNSIIRKKKC